MGQIRGGQIGSISSVLVQSGTTSPFTQLQVQAAEVLPIGTEDEARAIRTTASLRIAPPSRIVYWEHPRGTLYGRSSRRF